jgi:hypothetical protein
MQKKLRCPESLRRYHGETESVHCAERQEQHVASSALPRARLQGSGAGSVGQDIMLHVARKAHLFQLASS